MQLVNSQLAMPDTCVASQDKCTLLIIEYIWYIEGHCKCTEPLEELTDGKKYEMGEKIYFNVLS